MKQFNLREYLENPSREVITREGWPVRIVCTDANNDFPVIALLKMKGKEEESVYSFQADGTYYRNGQANCRDLFFKPEYHKGWVNLYYNVCGTVSTDTTVFPSKELAQAAKKYYKYIDTIPVEWED